MDFLISDALAQAGPTGSSMFGSIIPFVAIIGIFYFMIIRPQMKRAKDHKNLISELAKGDEVVTNGGLFGKITQVADAFLGLELADGVEVKLQKQAVASVLPKGTIKDLDKN